MSQSTQHTNRLIHSTSPYLQQHARNPVDWYPWGDEALRQAREQNKPILLSIGYSACHWCHVMERESFESEDVAGLMNEHFINIKVDREERPDLDAIYMNFVQMTTGSSGWPLTVFLTPDQLPFYGGTYFPPDDYYGRPGFKRVLQSVAEVYRSRREEIEKNRDGILARLQQMAAWEAPAGGVDEKTLHDAASRLARDFDPRHGGFGGAPKFPAAMALGFLLRYHKRTGADSALSGVTVSLNKMAQGGLYDQLGGGFHRYSVDERWLVPHFEKMLYDNALLSRVYLEAYQLTGNSYYREIVEETLAYIQREMTSPEGGFYSAYDADSEGEEGKFYVWTPEAIEAVLGPEEARIFCDYYDVFTSGNFEGKSILHHRMSLGSYAATLGKTPEDLKGILDASRRRLFKEREKRIKPGLDDKVLAAWNGLMLISFADAAFVLGNEELRTVAVRNAEFLASHMRPQGRLRRSWKDGKAELKGYLEDYALVTAGWISTYEATGDVRWLEESDRLMQAQIDLFFDGEKGDFYFTPRDHEELLVRQKEYMDNATPSGNSVSCLNLLRLSVLLGRRDYREMAGRMLGQVAGGAAQYPSAFGYWLQAFDFFLGPVREIAVVGSLPERDALLEPVRRKFIPNKVVAMTEEDSKELAKKVPLLDGKSRIDDQAAVFVCENYTCRQPVTSAEKLEQLL